MRTLLAVAGLAVVLALPSHAIAAANDPVASVEPACPEWTIGSPSTYSPVPPTILVRYNPKAPDARLSSSQTLTVVAGMGFALFSPFKSIAVPMLRSDDGAWQVQFTPQKNYLASYWIFFFRDEKGRVDNNRNQYWEALACDHSHVVDDTAVEIQAATYEGRLLAPGIQRPRDLARAIEILKADSQPRPLGVTHDAFIWRLELEKDGRNPATYGQIAKQLDEFLNVHAHDQEAMGQAVNLVAPEQQNFPPSLVERFRAALTALPETAEAFQINAVTKEVIHVPRDARSIAAIEWWVKRYLAEMDFWPIAFGKEDPREKAQAYLAFADKYPDAQSPHRVEACYDAFQCEKKLNDVDGAEAVFEKWTEAAPQLDQPFTEMAQFYIDRKIKSARALELLDAADKIYLESKAPGSTRHFQRLGQLRFRVGEDRLLLNDLPGARTDLEAAFQADPDDPAIAYALGETCERMGDKVRALAAYLSAASAPYQEDGRPAEAYERLFVQQRLGTKKAAEQKIDAAVVERTKAAADDYTPMALNRAAPKFAFTDLNGKTIDNNTAKGKPTVLTFWGIWCPPCIVEMPAILEFQKQHPEVNILAIEIGNKPDEVKAFLAAHKLNGLHAAAQADWPSEFVGAGAPTSIVMDRFGQIQFLHGGRIADVEAILGKDVSALPQGN